MTSKTRVGLLVLPLLLALAMAPQALAAPSPVQAAATLGVTLSFSPNPVSVNSQTQIQVSVTGGTGPYSVWFNASIPGCSPPSQPIQQPQPTSSYPCNPTSTGSFPAHLDVADSAGNHGSGSATLNVQSTGGGTGGSGTGNGTGGIDLSFLQNLLPVLMVTGILFVGSTVAIAVSAVALAVLLPRRLKQLRKAIEAQPLAKPAVPSSPPEAPKEQPPGDEL